jgi:hypothetical protein
MQAPEAATVIVVVVVDRTVVGLRRLHKVGVVTAMAAEDRTAATEPRLQHPPAVAATVAAAVAAVRRSS